MNRNGCLYKLRNYIRRTLKNKLIAVMMLIAGFVVWKLDSDATVLVFLSLFAIPLFLTKKDCTY